MLFVNFYFVLEENSFFCSSDEAMFSSFQVAKRGHHVSITVLAFIHAHLGSSAAARLLDSIKLRWIQRLRTLTQEDFNVLDIMYT